MTAPERSLEGVREPRTAARTAFASLQKSLEVGFAVALALGALLLPPTPATAAPLESTRQLSAQLKRAGRAEVTLSWQVGDGRLSGTLALEPPSLARLVVAATGEKVTLRADGGEWLQPALHQMVRLSPEHSGAAMRWWRLLAGGEPARERRLGRGGYRLVVGTGRDADSADVWLDARGFPARLVLGEAQTYSLRGWRFTRARGVTGFRIQAPAGVEVVELP